MKLRREYFCIPTVNDRVIDGPDGHCLRYIPIARSKSQRRFVNRQLNQWIHQQRSRRYFRCNIHYDVLRRTACQYNLIGVQSAKAELISHGVAVGRDGQLHGQAIAQIIRISRKITNFR